MVVIVPDIDLARDARIEALFQTVIKRADFQKYLKEKMDLQKENEERGHAMLRILCRKVVKYGLTCITRYREDCFYERVVGIIEIIEKENASNLVAIARSQNRLP